MSSSLPSSKDSFSTLYAHLLTLPPTLLPPSKPTSPHLTNLISSLYIHPTLEVTLHLLNADLPSAHFLCRHMQAPPAFEGMFLHGILHRIEGDYDNARAWYGNVADSEVFNECWGSKDEALGFIGEVEGLGKKGKGDKGELGRRSVEEVKRVVEFCRRKFGEGEVKDARVAWTEDDEEQREMKKGMVTGGEGFRKF